MGKKPNEYRFEEWIEISLKNSGYQSKLYSEYDRGLCLIKDDLISFIKETQPKQYEKLQSQFDSLTDDRIFKTINDEISKKGIVKVLREGISTRGSSFELLYFKPKSGLNPEQEERYNQNKFVVVRQLHYSKQNENSIDMVLFLNGIPIITMELKNQLTGQNVKNSEYQYKNDRDPKEPLLRFKRCLVHFCVDNTKVSMTTRLSGKGTRFLPYNKDIENPFVENDYTTEYLWNEILTPDSILDIIENFVVVVKEKDREWSSRENRVIEKESEILIFPRYHQLDVIRKLRNSIRKDNVGNNYLIQHTTGSGKSYSIGWLSHMLTSLYQSKEDTNRMFDSIIVITDRKVLDKQLQNTLTQLERTTGVVQKIDKNSEQLRESLEKGKSIIVTTIQKFSVVVEKISELKGHKFGVVIDEVHSSQTGESSKNLKKVLSVNEYTDSDEESFNDTILKEIESRRQQNHISFFGFTGTPKNKTLELFGNKTLEGKFVPFHSYTMKQSIFEGFTLDVLKHYSTYKRYFKLKQKESGVDVEIPEGKGMKELMSYVDKHPEVIRQKVKIILDHFSTVTSRKINGQGRGMVVVSSRYHCVLFFTEMRKQMKERNLSYSCLVGFSGSINYQGKEHTETSLNNDNGMEGTNIPNSLKDPRFRVLIVSNKFQTGFDEPLLHSMYVDKRLGGVQCVQTLSRLNRTKSGKTDTFVLDFVNDTESILESFQPYFTSTELSGETEPDKLYDLQYEINEFNVFTQNHVDEFCVEFYKQTETDEKLQPILNQVVENWRNLEEDKQRDEFKSKIQSFCRLYSYISQIVTFNEVEWEKLFIFLKYLNKFLPKGKSERIDISDSVNLDSLRIQMIGESNLGLTDEVGSLDPPSDDGTGKTKEEEETELLSEIIKRVNEVYGVELKEEDLLDLSKIQTRINSDEELQKVMIGNNTEDDKKKEFNDKLKNEVSGFYGDKIDFYKKVIKPEVFGVLMDHMYREYKKHHRSNS